MAQSLNMESIEELVGDKDRNEVIENCQHSTFELPPIMNYKVPLNDNTNDYETNNEELIAYGDGVFNDDDDNIDYGGIERIDTACQLRKSVKRKNIHSIRWLLKNKVNASKSVHSVCQEAEEDILYYLVTSGGVDVNAQVQDGKTLTVIAAENGNDGCIGILASANANLDEKDSNGDSPLIIAASKGHASTVKELLTNGASFEVKDRDGKNALQRAILSNSDEAAANIIRLVLQEEYLRNYIDKPDVGLLKIVRWKMKESLKAILDQMLVQVPTDQTKSESSLFRIKKIKNKQEFSTVVQTKYIDFDHSHKQNHNTENDSDYSEKRQYFLKRILDMWDEPLAYTGTVRILTDKKMTKYGNWYLFFKILFHFFFVLALSYSLIQATYENVPRDSYTRSARNIIRIFTELYVLLYFAFNIAAEVFELFRIFQNRSILNKENLQDQIFIKRNKKKNDPENEGKKKDTSILWTILQTLGDYFSDTTKYFEIVGLVSLLFVIILRLSKQPTQWEFATITNLINAMRLFQLVAIVPYIGPYANIFFQILKREVPKFLGLYSIYLFMFATSYFIALRTPYTAEGFRNQSLMQDTDRVQGVDNDIQWTFLSGIRILLEGNLYEDEYLYKHLNWSAALLYLFFLFLTAVVFLNIFIAQLSDSYSEVKENAERAYAWHRLNFIVHIQTNSLLTLFNCYMNKLFFGDITIEKDEMREYYGIDCIKKLNTKHFTEKIEVKAMLASIQNQQIYDRKTREISKSHAKVQHTELKDTGIVKIRELKDNIDTLTTSMTKLVHEVQEMGEREVRQEEKFTKSLDGLMKLIQEKLQ